MKLSLFSALLLALSSVQVTVSAPSTAHDEDTFKKRNNTDHFNEVAVRAASDLDAVQVPNPWLVGGLTFIATVAATAIGNLISNSIQKQIDAGTHQADSYYVIQDTSQSVAQLISDLGNNIGNLLPNYRILLIQAGAIDSVGFTDPNNYWWMLEQVQGAEGTLDLDVILGQPQTGAVSFPAYNPDGTPTLFYTVNGVGIEATQTTNQGYPAEYAIFF